jgi:hypothetical protein
MADLTPAQLQRMARTQLDPVRDLALVWDASDEMLKAIASGSLVGAGLINAVTDGGVDNTGVAPASAPLNLVLDQVEAQGGGVVFLPPGIYRNDSLIRVGDNTTLLGAGRGATVIRSDTEVTGFAGAYGAIGCIGKTRASIRSLTLDHTTNSCTTNGICLWPSDPATATGTPSASCTIADCEILGFDSHQYLIWNRHSDDSLIAFNYVDGRVTSFAPGSRQEGIEIFGGRRVTVIGNHVSNVGNSGLFPSNAPDFPDHSIEDVLIVSNTVSRCGHGIFAGAAHGPIYGAQILSRVQIRGNTVNDCWLSGITLNYSGTGEPPGTVVMRDVVVDGNLVTCGDVSHSPVAFNFDVQTVNATTDGCVVSNNTFRGGRPLTGGAVQASRAHGSTWRGNRILAGEASVHGMSVVETNGLVFDGNEIRGAGLSAIVLVGVRGSRFAGNHFAAWDRSEAGQNCIALLDVTNTVFFGNSFDSSAVGDVFCLQGPDSESAGLAVFGNVVQGAAQGPLPELVRSPGSDGVRGILTIPDGSSSASMLNSRVRPLTPVQVTQVAGLPAPFVAECGEGVLTIQRAITPGAARYCWQLSS